MNRAAAGLVAAVACVLLSSAHAQTENQRRRAEVEQTLNAFADRYATHIVAATGAIEAGNPSAEQRRLAHLIKLGAVSSMYDIATEPDLAARILDMVLMVTLQSYLWIDEDRADKMFGSRGEHLRRAIRQMRVEVWAMAGRMAPADQLQQLDALILDWRRRNADLEIVAYTRVRDVSGVRREAGLDAIQRATGFFAEIAEATKVADDARLLAERAFYAAKRMPFLLNWQAEALLNEALAKPELAKAIDAAERFSAAAERLPAHVTSEREAVIAVLEDQNGKLAATLGDIRKTAAAADGVLARVVLAAETAERLSLNVRETTKTVDTIMNRRSPAPAPGEKPFDIEPYARAAGELNQAVAGLNSALLQFDGMSTKRAWGPALDDTQRLMSGQIDQLFWRALVLMAAFFAMLLAYRWLVRRW